jgi:hypothetical protein
MLEERSSQNINWNVLWEDAIRGSNVDRRIIWKKNLDEGRVCGVFDWIKVVLYRIERIVFCENGNEYLVSIKWRS